MKKKNQMQQAMRQLHEARHCRTDELPWLTDEELEAVYRRAYAMPSVPLPQLPPAQRRPLGSILFDTFPTAAAIALVLALIVPMPASYAAVREVSPATIEAISNILIS